MFSFSTQRPYISLFTFSRANIVKLEGVTVKLPFHFFRPRWNPPSTQKQEQTKPESNLFNFVFFRIQLKAKNRWKTFTHRNLFQIENWNGKNSFISSLFALSWDKTSSASLPLGVVEHFWLFSWFGIWMILFFSHVSDEFSNEWEDKFVE